MSSQSPATVSGSAVTRVAAVDAGVVDEDRDRADGARDLLRGVDAGGAVAHVERYRVRGMPEIGDLVPHRLGRPAVDVEDDHLGALLRVTERDRASDPRSAAGDRRAVSFE